MNSLHNAQHPSLRYELHFRSLFNARRGYAFPCDAAGHVDMDTLSDRGRDSYLCAWAAVGHEFSSPTVQLAAAA